MAAVSERLFQLRHRSRQRGLCRTFSRHTGDDSLADTVETIAWLIQNLLARNTDDGYGLFLPHPDLGLAAF